MSAVQTSFGRVDESGNVYLLENGAERLIGSQPTMSADEALAFYTKRFEDLQANVRLLEQRVKAKADPKSIIKSAKKIASELENPNVLGDVQSLRVRVSAIESSLSQLLADLEKQREQDLENALKARETIVSTAEEIAAKDPNRVNYKQASAKMAELFNQWQALQKENVRVPRAKADALWKRFSQARNTFESNKRAYFTNQDQLAKSSKNAKLDIVTKAEALVAKGADGVTEYKNLLNAWKALPKVKAKSDDSLWDRFKAAGDAIYAAKSEKAAADDIAFAANLELKLALLAEAEALDPSANLESAKSAMKSIQARWEKAGKVPRDSIKKIDDRLRAVETKIRNIEQEIWRKTDPATIDRTNSLKSQLEESISKLEKELAEAKASGNAKAVEQAEQALQTKKSWLEVVEKG
ncbi:MAG: DUF349 domain-containing protein [Acidobacteria bacterium]|nr:DUF349 domain-containing protein [Acidobacteriota bacterium]